MSLKLARTEFKNKLKKILYDAYMMQFNGDDSVVGSAVRKTIENQAESFAKDASEGTSEAIYKFLLEIDITMDNCSTIIAPPAPPTLPGGPCTGVIPITNIEVQ